MNRALAHPCRPHGRRGGFTLIEVIAALALLGTLLVSIALARARYVHQWSTAERRLEAVAALDRLLEDWSQQPASMPRDDAGALADGLEWRTHSRADEGLDDLGARIVRVEVFDQPGEDGRRLLAHAELFVPHAPETEAEAEPEREAR